MKFKEGMIVDDGGGVKYRIANVEPVEKQAITLININDESDCQLIYCVELVKEFEENDWVLA